ncbi:MAG: RNA 2',3'-cyclic phosphodiesterase [Planctomycetes bacterium]|nr:RNA 2',3'-cyclic phosphodiesterase [Planctomycetota bacterium]
MPKAIRTFIAVEISPAIRTRLVAMQQELASTAQEVKWVEEENLHVTLKFLGQVDEREVYAVCRLVQEAVAGQAPFDMTVAGIGAFPNANRPRVLWAGVTAGGPELIQIHGHLERALRAEGYPREDRPYTPHITLGRIRQIKPNPQLAAALEQHRDWDVGQKQVREVLVMASQLSSGGPHYTVMGRGALAVPV